MLRSANGQGRYIPHESALHGVGAMELLLFLDAGQRGELFRRKIDRKLWLIRHGCVSIRPVVISIPSAAVKVSSSTASNRELDPLLLKDPALSSISDGRWILISCGATT